MTGATSVPRCQRWGLWAFWLLLFVAINTDVVLRPLKRTTMPTYRLAAAQWWAGENPYANAHEHSGDAFLYFPQAAVIFSPFAALPFFVGEILWRALTFGLFAYALARLASFFVAREKGPFIKNFLLLSLLAVPASLASLRNAQFDLPLAAFIVLTAAEVARNRWTAAAAWLCLAVAFKPLAVVPMLLFGALYRRQLLPRLLIGLLVAVALPFLHWNPAFVAQSYAHCFETLVWAAQAGEPRYSDLSALLSHVGLYPSNDLKTGMRVVFALVYLGLGFAATRRLEKIEAAWAIAALSADYLMLFNPRTETCSYVFLSPYVASLALVYAQRPERKWLGWVLGFAAIGFACDAFPTIGSFSIHYMTDRWLKPLLALLFLPVLVEFIFGDRSPRHVED